MRQSSKFSEKLRSIPIILEFAPGSRIERLTLGEPNRGTLPWEPETQIPGVCVLLKSGKRISLPEEQLVLTEEDDSGTRVGLGGMSFEGIKDGKLEFWRVRDLRTEDQDSIAWSDRIVLDPSLVTGVVLQGTRVWPKSV